MKGDNFTLKEMLVLVMKEQKAAGLKQDLALKEMGDVKEHLQTLNGKVASHEKTNKTQSEINLDLEVRLKELEKERNKIIGGVVVIMTIIQTAAWLLTNIVLA